MVETSTSLRRREHEDAPGRYGERHDIEVKVPPTYRGHDNSNKVVEDLPVLVKASSESSSSHSPNASPRRKKASKRQKQRRSTNASTSTSNTHFKLPEDTSIIRGAQILRQQLLLLDDDETNALLGPIRENQERQERRGYPVRRDHHDDDEEDDEEDSLSSRSEDNNGDDFSDPWDAPTPTRGRSQHIGKDISAIQATGTWGDDKSAFSFPIRGDASAWAELSSSNSFPDLLNEEEHFPDLLNEEVDLHELRRKREEFPGKELDPELEKELDFLASADYDDDELNFLKSKEDEDDELNFLESNEEQELEIYTEDEQTLELLGLAHAQSVMTYTPPDPSPPPPQPFDETEDSAPEALVGRDRETLLDRDRALRTKTKTAYIASPPPPAHFDETEDLTPETLVGRDRETLLDRDRALRTKTKTAYIVKRVDEMEALLSSYGPHGSLPPPAAGGTLSPSRSAASSYLPYGQSQPYNPNPSSHLKYSQSTPSYLPYGLSSAVPPPPPPPRPAFRSRTEPDQTKQFAPTPTPTPPTTTLQQEEGAWTPQQWDDQDLLQQLQEDEIALQDFRQTADDIYLREVAKRDPNVCMLTLFPPPPEISPCINVLSPTSRQYSDLQRDPAYLHAQRAGTLWQSIVSQHVRFPKSWWKNDARGPPLGIGENRSWSYHGRHRVGDNPVLNKLVQSRGSAGRILLHVIVRDIMTLLPIQDMAIGCFHPNARGIRETTAFDPLIEDCRDVWLAVRRRVPDKTVVESLLRRNDKNLLHPRDNDNNDDDDNSKCSSLGTYGCEDGETPDESPLGQSKHAVDNHNVRAVFGDQPPLRTLILMESEVFEHLSEHSHSGMPPALLMMQQFLRP
jgi:hypothetical protein